MNYLDITYLPEENKKSLKNTFANTILTFELVNKIKETKSNLDEYVNNYRSLHLTVRKIQKNQFKIDNKIKKLEKEKKYLKRENETKKVIKIQAQIDKLNNKRIEITKKIPSNWEDAHNQYKTLALESKKAITKYRRNVDSIYKNIKITKIIIEDRIKLDKLDNKILNLKKFILSEPKKNNITRIKNIEKFLDEIEGTDLIKEKLSKARRILKKDNINLIKINSFIDEANENYILEKKWRLKATKDLLPKLIKFDNSVKDTIGLRLQKKLSKEQAKYVAACRSVHKDISLNF